MCPHDVHNYASGQCVRAAPHQRVSDEEPAAGPSPPVVTSPSATGPIHHLHLPPLLLHNPLLREEGHADERPEWANPGQMWFLGTSPSACDRWSSGAPGSRAGSEPPARLDYSLDGLLEPSCRTRAYKRVLVAQTPQWCSCCPRLTYISQSGKSKPRPAHGEARITNSGIRAVAHILGCIDRMAPMLDNRA